MNKVYLCGHTGSENRGCEAIVRSTIKILNYANLHEIKLFSWDRKYDEFLGLDQNVDIVSYPQKNILKKSIDFILKKIIKDKSFAYNYYNSIIIERADKNDLIFNIGGDIYCYDEPMLCYSLNKMAKKKDIKTIFWGCSIDEKIYHRKLSVDDINRYNYIAVRESLSQKIFNDVLINKKKLHRICDPAFLLDIKKTQLPEFFIKENTVGINISPLVFNNVDDLNDMMYLNVFYLIAWILEETNMNICLIPHVYNIERNSQDIKVLKKIYSKFSDTKRISIIQEELSCCELKYIISNCRFFLGARTHATIAAYSTSIPTIALSYSIKSRGIARDLFGEEEHYVISWKNINKKEKIKEMMSYLIENEANIKAKYNSTLPAYKETVLEAVNQIKEIIND